MNDIPKLSRINLIVISLAIVLYYLGEIQISRFSFFGMEISVGRPYVFELFGWVAWVYFYLRYVSFYFDSKASTSVAEAINDSKAYFSLIDYIEDTYVDNARREQRKIVIDNYQLGDSYKYGFVVLYEAEIVYPTASVPLKDKYEFYYYRSNRVLNIKSFLRAVYVKPEILEYVAPFFIGMLPGLMGVFYLFCFFVCGTSLWSA
jgi:hypothetical protein